MPPLVAMMVGCDASNSDIASAFSTNLQGLKSSDNLGILAPVPTRSHSDLCLFISTSVVSEDVLRLMQESLLVLNFCHCYLYSTPSLTLVLSA